MKKIIAKISIFLLLLSSGFAFADDTVVKNRYFSLSLPEKLKGSYETKVKKDYILIYDSVSKKAGFGGFAFGLRIYKKPSEHAMMVGTRKIGELTDKKGNLYDMVLIQPTDIQYDYVADKKDEYMKLYNLAEQAEIKGVRGSQYHKNQGMKGADLYNDVLLKHIRAIKEKWPPAKLEYEKMSYMYYPVSKTKNPLNKIGYSYYDINGDGIDELFIGPINQKYFKGLAYDIYTMKDRKPVHVISGNLKDRYFACDEAFICNEYSSNALDREALIYSLNENSNQLFFQVGFKYYAYKNRKSPWFISYDLNYNWDNVSYKTYRERKKVFDNYKRFNYIPLNKI